MTSLECIFRESCFEAVERLPFGGVRWFATVAAMGSENREIKRDEEARRKLEVNSLAVAMMLY